MTPKRQFIISFSVIILIIFAVGLANILVIKLRRSTLMDKMDEREYNATIARYHDYDAMILGTSMSECFKCSELDHLFQVHSHKFTICGAHISNIVFTARYALKYHRVKLMLCDLQFGTLMQRGPDFPFPAEYYRDNTFWTELRDSIGIRAVRDNLRFLSRKKKLVISRDELYNWSDKVPYGKFRIARKFFSSVPRKADGHLENDYGLQYLGGNLKNHLIPFLEENRNIRMIFYFPPYSIYAYRNRDEYMAFRKAVMDVLLNYPNVEVYDFQVEKKITLDSGLYRDPTHYHGSINSWMLQQIAQRKYRVTKENRAQFEADFAAMVNAVDYDKLLADLKDFYQQELLRRSSQSQSQRKP